MAGLMERASLITQAKVSKLLGRAENPDDLSLEEAHELLHGDGLIPDLP